MVTGKEDLLQALIEVFLMEKGTHDFYSHAAASAQTPDSRETFAHLTDWEEKHMLYIQRLYQAIQDDHDIIGFGEFTNKTDAPFTEAGIPVKDLEEKAEQLAYSDDRSAVELALEIEGKAYNLYRRLSESAADPNARVVFKEMMAQEQEHINYLQKMRK